MTGQLSFDTGASPAPVSLPARARRTDPSTSHAAASSLSDKVLSKQRTEVLNVVRAMTGTPYDGATAWDVARSTNYQQSVCARRLTDLHELGLIEPSGRTRPGSSNRELTVWRPT